MTTTDSDDTKTTIGAEGSGSDDTTPVSDADEDKTPVGDTDQHSKAPHNEDPGKAIRPTNVAAD